MKLHWKVVTVLLYLAIASACLFYVYKLFEPYILIWWWKTFQS